MFSAYMMNRSIYEMHRITTPALFDTRAFMARSQRSGAKSEKTQKECDRCVHEPQIENCIDDTPDNDDFVWVDDFPPKAKT